MLCVFSISFLKPFPLTFSLEQRGEGRIIHEGRTDFAQLRDWLPKYELANANEKWDWRIFSDFANALIAIIRKQANLPHSPYTILQILSVTVFEKSVLLRNPRHAPRALFTDFFNRTVVIFFKIPLDIDRLNGVKYRQSKRKRFSQES